MNRRAVQYALDDVSQSVTFFWYALNNEKKQEAIRLDYA